MSELNNILALVLNAFSIKTPQLVGILAGCVVFIITIGTVFYLLYASGSFKKLAEELKAGKSLTSGAKGKEQSVTPQFSSQPELYEHLLQARQSLLTTPHPPILKGSSVSIRLYNPLTDYHELQILSDGRALFHESAYDPARISGWLDLDRYIPKLQTSTTIPAYKLLENASTLMNGCHMVIIDLELNKLIGMLSLVDNCPRNLSIRIDNIWITPAFQGKKRSHEAVLLLIQWLNTSGYRRITSETDERHIIGRKFLTKCGFLHEATLYKHRIIHNRNSNTTIYTILNSDFFEIETKLKVYLGYNLKPTMHKIAEIDTTTTHTNGIVSIGNKTNINNQKKNEKKKNKRKNKGNNIVW